jgi:hypothetical protein
MRYLFTILFTWLIFSPVFSQDVLVLRKDESEVKCRIVSLSDSVITYKLWNSEDKTIYSVRKYEVQSYMMDYKSRKSKKLKKSMKEENADRDLLGTYRNGSVESGYIIRENGDTLKGLVVVQNFALNQVRVEFSDSGNVTKTHTTKDLKGYGYSNISYDRVPLKYKQRVTNSAEPKQQQFFLHRAVSGPSKLYRFYTLDFSNSTMKAYDQVPPYFLGKAEQHFVITNPSGRKLFTRGRTLKGSVNTIYSDYNEFTENYRDNRPKAGDLPGIVNSFNYWFENRKQD